MVTVRATSSSITAALTAALASFPIVNGPWLAIKTAGERLSRKVSTIPRPIESSPIAEISQVSDVDARQVSSEIAANLDLESVNAQPLSNITDDLTLPQAKEITWTSAQEAIVASDGKVSQPDADTQVTVTANIDVRGQTTSRDFNLTVLAKPDAKGQAQVDLAEINLDEDQPVLSSISLPEIGNRYGSQITWQSSAPEIIDVESGTWAPGVVKRPLSEDEVVTLTATATVDGQSVTREFKLTVKQAQVLEPTTDYLFAHFTGTERKHSDEQIYFATSRDAVTFEDTRSDGNPVLSLAADQGDGGVRDPYLVRSPEGDKFYLFATDLSIYHRGGWGKAQATVTRSTKIVVWESADLVHWSQPWLPDIAGSIGDAGNAWAPEAIWDDAQKQYFVFWATRSPSANQLGDQMNVFYATTRDFKTFSKPVLWIDRESSIIDTTVSKVGDWYYRASGDGQITIEKSKNLASPTISARAKTSGSDNDWVLVGTLQSILEGSNDNCRTGRNYTGGCLEGAEFFKYNADDQKGAEALYGLIADQYASGTGYLPFKTTDISLTDKSDWSVERENVNFGTLKKRHGTILPITEKEYQRVMYHYAGQGTNPDSDESIDNPADDYG